jgi:excisionase family DNA binding protein
MAPFPYEPNRESDDPPTLLTVPEVARLLRIGLNRAYQLCRAREIPSLVIGHTIRVPREALERWIERQGNGREP